ncbi:transposase [Streptomyces sp. NPDC127038]|uniref:transposase n=1 Tax=Streptomyces sp. NPDC127038 TaxID=3347114 RepID=UPI0036690502
MLLSADEQAVLERWATPARTPAPAPTLALRARIVLACAGPGVPPIVSVARELRVAADTVRKWRRRFVAERLNGLDGPAGPTAAGATDAASATDAAGASDAADGSPSDLAAARRRIAELDAELAIHRRAAELLG